MQASPWLSIPLADYEGHMSAEGVGQLAALSDLFGCVMRRYRPESVTVLGIAGGNGLEHIDSAITQRVSGVDCNERYLEATRQRFGGLAGLELHRADLAADPLRLAPAALVHAALIFEHTGLGLALENALALVAPEGGLSVVLQLPSREQPGVTPTPFASMQALDFTLVEPEELSGLLAARGFDVVAQERRELPGGKAFQLLVLSRVA